MSKLVNFRFWFVYIAFVIYGSLVPLDYHPKPLNQALDLFFKIPMLNLGIGSRADWVANGVLYFPVGFLTFHGIRQTVFGYYFPVAAFISLFFSLSLAVGIEFSQLFFPPRTVSLNDLLAESIGSFMGVLAAAYVGSWYKAMLESFVSKIGALQKHLLEGYALFYIIYSLFPYDFLVSAQEVKQKINGDLWGWFVATNTVSGNILLYFAKQISEIIITVPIGILVSYLYGRRLSYFKIFNYGLGFGIAIELLQFFTASGVSQGMSAITRGIGFLFGAKLYADRLSWSSRQFQVLIKKLILLIVPIHFLVLAWVTGWFSNSLKSSAEALSELTNNTHFLPFYYHYYTTEAIALESLASIAFLYFPIGVISWAYRGSPILAGWFALIASCVMEASKLFLASKHSDPTNLLIAFLASYIATRLCFLFEKGAKQSSREDFALPRSNSQEVPKVTGGSLAGILPVAGLLAFLIYWLLEFPVFKTTLTLGFLGYCICIWLRPKLIFFIVPVALPLLDLASWSGRFFFDEFDILLLTSLVIGFVKSPQNNHSKQLPIGFALCISWLTISYLISTIIGLLPWQPVDANAFSNYMSNYNALRISKGVMWFLPLLYLAKRQVENGVDVERLFRRGLIFGLLGTVGFILIERLIFTGLFDFSSEHRAVGPFSAIHVGGAYVECFLVVSVPFLLKEISQTKSKLLLISGGALLVLASYALMVTFSRGGYLAFAISLLLFAFLILAKKTDGHAFRQSVVIVFMVLLSIAVAVPVVSGQFAQRRLMTIEQDFETRLQHWEKSIAMMQDDFTTVLFGMGVGKYPVTYYWNNQDDIRSGSFRLVQEEGHSFLKLGPGTGFYVDQVISDANDSPLTVSVRARSSNEHGSVSVSICRKWLLSSAHCIWQTLNIGSANTWVERSLTFTNAAEVDADGWSFVPRYFSVSNSSEAVVDVAEIQLNSEYEKNLLSNDDFSAGFDHWFFQADEHLSWHAKNIFLASFFDQGILGVTAFCTILMLSLYRSKKTHQEHWAIAGLAFCIVGLFDSLIDTPRFVLLLMILLGFPFILKSDYPLSYRKMRN